MCHIIFTDGKQRINNKKSILFIKTLQRQLHIWNAQQLIASSSPASVEPRTPAPSYHIWTWYWTGQRISMTIQYHTIAITQIRCSSAELTVASGHTGKATKILIQSVRCVYMHMHSPIIRACCCCYGCEQWQCVAWASTAGTVSGWLCRDLVIIDKTGCHNKRWQGSHCIWMHCTLHTPASGFHSQSASSVHFLSVVPIKHAFALFYYF